MGKAKQINENLKKKYLGEMANLKPELTGIKGVTLFCSPEMGSHSIRVKVYNATKNIHRSMPNLVFSVENDPKVIEDHDHIKGDLSKDQLSKIKYFIYYNQKAIKDLWLHKIGDKEFKQAIEKGKIDYENRSD